jgi:hypothetical protein
LLLVSSGLAQRSRERKSAPTKRSGKRMRHRAARNAELSRRPGGTADGGEEARSEDFEGYFPVASGGVVLKVR